VTPFTELGALVESRWRDRNYHEDFFAGIAAQALDEANLCDRVDPWAIVRWVHETPTLPVQMDLQAAFGNPPITLYMGPRFFIDAYYWLDGTTTIHQHAFSGAFQVLHGSSVHANYHFDVENEISPHLLTGKLAFRDVFLLKQGDIREINAGPAFIHSLFHLERPSVTITIRTHKAPDFARQYSYLKPHLAVNPFFVDASLMKRVQTVSLLLRMKHPQADDFIGALLEATDFHTAYEVLKEAFDFLCHRELEEIVGSTRSRDRFQALLKRARSKHGQLVELLEPVFEEEWRQSEIIRRRAQITDEAHRFFLALLLNVPDRGNILKLLAERFPKQNSVELIVEWLRQLTATKIFGSREPNVIGLGDFDSNHLFVFERLLQGVSPKEIETQARAAKMTAAIPALADQITAAPLFKPLFTHGE
jgi:predicted metal-dependent enzyme (double-stranded beta helix superfamily)